MPKITSKITICFIRSLLPSHPIHDYTFPAAGHKLFRGFIVAHLLEIANIGENFACNNCSICVSEKRIAVEETFTVRKFELRKHSFWNKISLAMIFREGRVKMRWHVWSWHSPEQEKWGEEKCEVRGRSRTAVRRDINISPSQEHQLRPHFFLTHTLQEDHSRLKRY